MHRLLLSFSVHARPFAGAARAAELDSDIVRGLRRDDVCDMGFPGLKRAPLLCEPVVFVIVRGVHIGLRVRENSEAGPRAERRAPRGPSQRFFENRAA